MTLRPLPKTVAPAPDELLSGWLIRLATTNYCEVDELPAHIGIAVRHPTTLDFEVDMATVKKIAIAARLDPETAGSLIFPPMAQAEAMLTARICKSRLVAHLWKGAPFACRNWSNSETKPKKAPLLEAESRI